MRTAFFRAQRWYSLRVNCDNDEQGLFKGKKTDNRETPQEVRMVKQASDNNGMELGIQRRVGI